MFSKNPARPNQYDTAFKVTVNPNFARIRNERDASVYFAAVNSANGYTEEDVKTVLSTLSPEETLSFQEYYRSYVRQTADRRLRPEQDRLMLAIATIIDLKARKAKDSIKRDVRTSGIA